MNALEQINADPTLAWLSETARAILAVALHKGAPLDMSRQDDTTRCVVAEYLVRCEGHSISDALALARSDVRDSHLRGIVRFASSMGDPATLDRRLDGRPVRSLSRQESIETALVLFALATIHAVPPPPAQSVELDDADDRFGRLIGRCTGCGGPTFFGHCTIAMGWPKENPRWETVTPNVATHTRRDRGRLLARGSKLRMLRDGELAVLCTTCTMRMKHAGWTPPPPQTETVATHRGRRRDRRATRGPVMRVVVQRSASR